MSFASLDYVVFLPLVVLAFWLVPMGARNLLLLAASWYFYACWDARFLGLMVGVTAVSWIAARAIATRPRARWLWCTLAVVLELGVLGLFKYYDFFVTSAQALLVRLGLDAGLETLGLILPVGISFYVFQAIGYVVDVHRGELEARRSFAGVALFISFFPQLVAGPIERATRLLPQIEAPRVFDPRLFVRALLLLAWGFFQKLVVADNAALVSEKIFALDEPGFLLQWTGVIAFAVQIVADFSGYTDIARGSAGLLGFELMRNFEHPYLAATPAEFWRRWHISLSTWLRDYLYIPLGGSRRGPRRTALNVAITFLLCGLWHGANWNFVIWGAWHGLLVGGERALRQLPWRPPRLLAWAAYPLGMALTFALICVGWLLFRERDLTRVAAAFVLPDAWGSEQDLAAPYLLALVLLYATPLALHAPVEALGRRLQAWGWWWPTAEVLLASLLLGGTLLFRSDAPTGFIYFQF